MIIKFSHHLSFEYVTRKGNGVLILSKLKFQTQPRKMGVEEIRKEINLRTVKCHVRDAVDILQTTSHVACYNYNQETQSWVCLV